MKLVQDEVDRAEFAGRNVVENQKKIFGRSEAVKVPRSL